MRDEFDRIEWLRARFEPADDVVGVDTLVGIGDDAAVAHFGPNPVVVSVDAQVEGVHFRRDLLSHRDLGARALIAAASDVWAMGSRPTGAVVALTLPNDLSDTDFRDLIDGVAAAASEVGLEVLGGNLSSGSSLTVTTTVLGASADPPLTRSGARPGDRLYVTGTVGWAALGLALLDGGHEIDGTRALFVSRWRRPPVHRETAPRLAGVASAAIDVSDGLLQDLQHLCTESGVGAIVRGIELPTGPEFVATCKELELDPVVLALSGGEDYELLFTMPPQKPLPIAATEIGEIVEGSEVVAQRDDGTRIVPTKLGYRHFG